VRQTQEKGKSAGDPHLAPPAASMCVRREEKRRLYATVASLSLSLKISLRLREHTHSLSLCVELSGEDRRRRRRRRFHY
jgi:hypothetical protein